MAADKRPTKRPCRFSGARPTLSIERSKRTRTQDVSTLGRNAKHFLGCMSFFSIIEPNVSLRGALGFSRNESERQDHQLIRERPYGSYTSCAPWRKFGSSPQVRAHQGLLAGMLVGMQLVAGRQVLDV